MAKDTKAPAIDKNALRAQFAQAKQKAIETVGFDRNIWTPLFAVPVRGIVVDYVEMPEADRKDNPEWQCFLVHLTAPTVVKNRDKHEVMAKPGDLVWVPANGKHRDTIMRYALDVNEVHEIGLEPKLNEKGEPIMTDIGGGRKMYEFEDLAIFGKKPRSGGLYQFDQNSKIHEFLNGAPKRELASGEKVNTATGQIA